MANHVEGCPCIRQGLRQVSEIWQPIEELTPIMALWPFAQWGLDIIGSFPTTVRQLKFLTVDIDYFIKWVEAEALATITEKNV